MAMVRWMVLAVLGAQCLAAAAQSRSYLINDCAGLRAASLPGGSHLVLTERRWGIDSSHVRLHLANASWELTPVAARRFEYPLWYLFDAAALPDGMVVSGHLSAGAIPQLHAVGNDGSLAWSVGFAGMTNSQHRIGILISEGPDIFGYSSQDGFFGSAVYRVEGDHNGQDFEFRMATVSGTQFRFYHGATGASAGGHTLGGSIRNTGTNDYDALLARFTADGAAWMKRIDLGAPAAGIEQVAGVTPMIGGGHAWTFYRSENPLRGYFIRTDESGGLISATLIEDPAGVSVSAVTQLYDGTFLLSAFSGNSPRLYRILGNGTLVSATECSGCTHGGIGRFQRDLANNLIGLGTAAVLELTPEGEACGYVDVGTSSTAPFTPTLVEVVAVNNLSPSVTTTPLGMLERGAEGTAELICQTVAVQERWPSTVIRVHPVPVSDVLRLGDEVGSPPGTVVHVLNTQGQVILRTTYSNGVDVSALTPGVYILTVPALALKARFAKQ